VLRCPCGGRRRIRAVHTTRQAAEQRLVELRTSPSFVALKFLFVHRRLEFTGLERISLGNVIAWRGFRCYGLLPIGGEEGNA